MRLLSLCCFALLSTGLWGQKLLVLNGGLFGSATETANLGVYDPADDSYQFLDSMGTNSVQDLLIEDDQYAYVAAQDSIYKYDLQTGDRLAAAAFGSVSTIKLGLYQNKLLVGNWYGSSSDNLRIFDKSDLSFQSSISQIDKGVKDFVVLGDTLYIAQNSSTASYTDTLGYLAKVNLTDNSYLGNDTLSSTGSELGRLFSLGDSLIVGINNESNSLSYLNINSGQKWTQSAAVNFQAPSYGNAVQLDQNGIAYTVYNGAIGSYDFINNTVIDTALIPYASGAFALDAQNGFLYVSQVNFGNQSSNTGIRYNLSGDSLGTFPVGFSPEVLVIWNTQLLNNLTEVESATFDFGLFPNPTSHSLTINLEEAQLGQYRIYNNLGQLLGQGQFSGQQKQIDVQNLEAGIYHILLQSEQGQQATKQFIKR